MGSMIDNTGGNRRASDRIQGTFQVRYHTLDSLVSAYTENISKGGLYIRTESLLPLNAMVCIRMVMPQDGPEIECIGQVARVHTRREDADVPTGMAVVFRDMSDDHRAFIEDYIAQKTSEPPRAATSLPTYRLSILVVDDDATVRRRTSNVLKRKGHQVAVAEDGLTALTMCLQDPPDLILSDVQMPRMDGWSFLKTIRARTSLSSTLVIFQTSLGSEKDRLRGYQLGVDDYLAKPYTARQLMESIDRLVSRSRNDATGKAGRNRALRGDLAQVSVSTVLSLLEMEKKTGVLIVVGDRIGRLYIRQGSPVSIELDGTEVEDRMSMVVELLSYRTGQFEFAPQDVPGVDRFSMTMQRMLMEAARIHDETGSISILK